MIFLACCAYVDRGCKKLILVPLYRFCIELTIGIQYGSTVLSHTVEWLAFLSLCLRVLTDTYYFISTTLNTLLIINTKGAATGFIRLMR